MIRLAKYACLFSICLTFQTRAQTTYADSLKAELQGIWRMDDDTNVVLVFYGDSMMHRMVRTSGSGRVRFRVTDKSCDSTRYKKKNSWYLEETFRYYKNKMPLEDKLCNKIIYLKNDMLILKRNDIFEDYTRLRNIPPMKK
jgi:hypothetical protein